MGTYCVIGISQLTGVTRNRRAGVSPYLNPDDIDPNLGVIGVNDANGQPLATGNPNSPVLCYQAVIIVCQYGIMLSMAHAGAPVS